MLRVAAHLPHAGVALLPALGGGVRELGDELLDLGMKLAELLVVDPERVEQLAVDVELGLAPGAVPDTDGARVAPAGKVGELSLGEVVLAADPVHDLERAALDAAARRRSS